jgi:hypothetical protein
MMKRPLVWSALFLCLGIIASSLIKVAFVFNYCLAVMFLFFDFLSIKKESRFDILLFLVVILLGGVLYKNHEELPKCHICRYGFYKNNQVYSIKGFVNSEPEYKNNRTSFVFKTEEIRSADIKRNCCGDILIYIRGKKILNYGEELILEGNLYMPFRGNNSARKSYRDYLHNQGIYSIMAVRTLAQAVEVKRNKGWAIKRFALRIKANIERIIYRHLSSIPASILDAMILGERKNISAVIYKSMMKSGTVHILPWQYTKFFASAF